MNNNPVKFFFKCSGKLLAVLLYPIDTNKDVAFQGISIISIVKGYNIGVIVMIQIFNIYLFEIFIGTEDVVQFIDFSTFFMNYIFYPLPDTFFAL